MLDAERCINCTRCTRFTHEISKTDQLSIIARGDKNFPTAGPGKTFDDPYSMNVIDLCPVGALTSADFRFKARVWEMNYTPSICTGCAKGCNVDVWVRDNVVLRQTPRENLAVNQYWMCDEGRLDYARFNENRVSGAKQRGDLPLPLLDGLARAAGLLQQHKGKILFVGLAFASVETNHALKKLARLLGQNEVFFVPHVQAGWGDSLLKRDDRTPNAAGCRLVGLQEIGLAELKTRAQKAELVYLVEDEAVATELVAAGKPVIAQVSQHFAGFENAELLLPAAAHVEAAGIFINEDQLPQQVMQAKQILRMTPEMWMAMPKSRLDAGGVAVDNWRNTDHIIDALPGWMLVAKLAEGLHIDLGVGSYAELFNELKTTYPQLAGLKLSKRNRKESFKMSQFEFAVR
jgi:NADH-quinone oxidoreductase subunit G